MAEALPEEDDEVLLVAAYEAERQLDPGDGGFCAAAGALWIYPTNCPVRDYQLDISRSALFCNTLVCLPTGLGKTFIAAVVMYNFYRWFPSGKVVFMAPTKPLVTQQMEACFHVMGIPQSHMAEMTGSTQAVNRKEIWSSRRVLFLTPQVMVNDLTRGAVPATHVKCLVVDEAHKALGNYAYCQVVRELVKYTTHFRILALSATPGSDIKAVQQVITNLLIGKIELRSEESPDILPYSHERRVEKLVVPLGEELGAIQKTYIQILETFASSLIHRNVLMKRDIPNLTKYQIILARDQFRKNPSPNIVGIQQGIIEGEFALCISLYHGYELLQQMGMRSLYFFLSGIMDGTKGMTRARNELSRNEDFMKLYTHLQSAFAPASTSDASAFQRGNKEKKFVYSHPKLKKLEEVILEHFKSWNSQQNLESNSAKRISHPTEKYCLPGTTHNKVSDRPSFCESDSEGHNIKYQNSGSNSCVQIQADLENNFVDKNSHDDSEPPVLFTDEDESLLLFEDDFKNIEDGPEELNGASLPPFNSISQPLRVSGKTLTSEMPPVSHFLISDELLLDDDSEPEDQIVCGAKSWKCQEGVEDGQEELRTDGQTFDCSVDLFSVTFDLGFRCSSGSDDEMLAGASDRTRTLGAADVSGRHSDKEIKDAGGASGPLGRAISPIPTETAQWSPWAQNKEYGNHPVQLKADSQEHSDTSAAPCSTSLLHVAEGHTAPRHLQEGNRACILVDSREITTGLEVISSLRTVHGLQVEICPLNGCDYIVSSRMVVVRRSQSEMLSNTSKNKFIEQMQRLQSMFQRICVIVEKDREKAGDTSKKFRRTKCYDSLLTALVGAGIRILFSSGQEETADLLKELSLVEQRKNAGIHIPAVLNTSKLEALPFYLSIPGISYITALNMCHQFSSVKKMANSSPEEISTCAQVNHQKAEEIYKYIHYIFDMQMLPNDLNQERQKPDTCLTLGVAMKELS